MSDEPPAPPARLEGWKDIANAMRITVRAAQERALRPIDPLPVRVGHRGPWAYTRAIHDWIHRQDMAYGAAVRLKRFSRLEKELRGSVEPDEKADETSH